MDEQDLVWYEPQSPDEIFDELIDDYKVDSLYVLVSGGQDSMSVDNFTRNHKKTKHLVKGSVFTNTGAGSQETRQFVLNHFHNLNTELFLTWPKPNERFLLTALRYGFAFAGNHGLWMGYLKQHSWYYFLKDRIKRGEKPAFISGVRKSESKVRKEKKQYTKKPIDTRDSSQHIYCKPFLYKNGTQLQEYKLVNNIKTTPVYRWANKSGECWCGQQTDPWDLKLLQKHDRLQFENIKFVESTMKIVLERLMKTNRTTFDQISNWYRLYTNKNKLLREKLTERQKQMVRLTYWNTWGNTSTDDAVAQMTFEDFKRDIEFEIDEDYCVESCGLIEVE